MHLHNAISREDVIDFIKLFDLLVMKHFSNISHLPSTIPSTIISSSQSPLDESGEMKISSSSIIKMNQRKKKKKKRKNVSSSSSSSITDYFQSSYSTRSSQKRKRGNPPPSYK